MTIKDAIKRIQAEGAIAQILVGKVVSVDEGNMTCEIDLETLPNMLDVRLRSVIDASQRGILVTPKQNSTVLVGLIENNFESAFIAMYSEVDKVKILTDDIQLSGEDFGGLVKAKELKKQVDKNSAILNTILQVLSTPVSEPGNGSPSIF